LDNEKGKVNGNQLQEAKLINEYKSQGKTFNEIGQILNKNGEACRSTLRRYESLLTNDINILNILDNEFDFTQCKSKKAEEICNKINQYEQSKGYGTYLVMNDFHEPYTRRKLIKEILLQPEIQKIDTVILNGDIGQFDVAGKWVADTDDMIETTLDKMSELFEVFANRFKKVYVIPGNHDLWVQRELNKSIRNGLKRVVKDISPIQTVINELQDKGIKNIEYTIQNELKLGNGIFAHPNEFCSVPGQTVIRVADTYLNKHRDLNFVVIGHTHAVFSAIWRNIAVYETGCMCYELEYKKKSKIDKHVWIPAFGIFTIKPDGNLDVNKSKVVSMT
jgi:predicted phosphodiesterase